MKRSPGFPLRIACVVALFLIYGPAPHVDAAEEVLTLTATSGAKMRTLLTGDPQTAVANLILLAGGDGRVIVSGQGEVKRMKGNFLVRTRDLFAAQGFLTAVVGVPFDRKKPPGLLGGFRASQEHAADLAKVAAALTAKNGKPVVVVGTSRGTVSAANLAGRQKDGTIAAAVLTSSLVRKSKKGANITDSPLNSIAVPVLFVHNRLDKCAYTLLKDLEPIIARMQKAGVRSDLIVVESSELISEPCKPKSPHGYLGIEQSVIEKVAAWIKQQL